MRRFAARPFPDVFPGFRIHWTGSGISSESGSEYGSGSNLDQRFWWPKSEEEKNTAEISFSFFDQNYTLLSLGLHKGRPSYRRSLPPSKEYIQYLKFINLFSIFVGHLWPPGSEYGSRDPTESGSNPDTDPDPKHWNLQVHKHSV